MDIIFLLFIVILLIVYEIFFKSINNITNIILLFVIFVFCFLFKFDAIVYNFVIQMNFLKMFFIFFVLFIFLICLNLIIEPNFDLYLLFLLVFFGSIIIILFDHFLIIYIGIELQTFSIFILIAKNKNSIKGSEASLKYFILGAISSGLFLLGLSLFFLSGISLNLNYINFFCGDDAFLLGLSLIIISLVFKLALSPFHFWLPDIYEGSSLDVLSLISTIPKISILSLFINLVNNSSFIIFLSLLSVIIGTIGALNQSKLKRLLAYSSISHMGFIILGFLLVHIIGYEISFIYLFIYMITTIIIFVLIINTVSLKDYYIIELSGLQYLTKIIAVSWLILFLSIAGIPPLSGFISKWFLLWNIISSDYYFSGVILILFSIIGIIYYLRIVKIIYFQKQNSYIIWNEVLKINGNNNYLNFIFIGLGIFFSLFLIFNLDFFVILINILISYFF